MANPEHLARLSKGMPIGTTGGGAGTLRLLRSVRGEHHRSEPSAADLRKSRFGKTVLTCKSRKSGSRDATFIGSVNQ